MQSQVSPKKILVADDHSIIRKTLHHYIISICPDAIIHEAFDSKMVKGLVAAETYDLIILDLQLDTTTPGWLVRRLLSLKPHLKIMVLTMGVERVSKAYLMDIGVAQYIKKTSGEEEIINAIQSLLFTTDQKSEKRLRLFQDTLIKYKRKFVETFLS